MAGKVRVAGEDGTAGTVGLPAAVVCSPDAGAQELLAGREIRRYAYLRTGEWLSVAEDGRLPAQGDAVVVARKDRPIVTGLVTDAPLKEQLLNLDPQQYVLRTIAEQGRRVLLVVGGARSFFLCSAHTSPYCVPLSTIGCTRRSDTGGTSVPWHRLLCFVLPQGVQGSQGVRTLPRRTARPADHLYS